MHGTKLVEQADEAFHLLQQVAGADSKTTQEFWHTISSSVDHREQLSEWCKLAGIAQVQVPGSVEEERVFSTLNYIKDERRNRLDERHLNVSLVLASQRLWSLKEFPFERAIKKWAAAKGRRTLAYGGSRRQQQHQHEQPDDEIIEIDSE